MTLGLKRVLGALAMSAALAAGGTSALVLTGDGAAASDDRSVFCSELVPGLESSIQFSKWTRSAPADAERWTAFRTSICAEQNPAPPAMTTALGRALVAAGKMAFDETPPVTTSTTTTTSATTTTAPEPAPPAVEYPASYFTGPLGAANPLPDEKGAFLIAWINAPRAEGTSWDAHRAQILEREAAIGRRYDGLMVADDRASWGENRLQWVSAHGAIPIVAGLNFGTHDRVLSGQANADIDAYADRYKALGVTVMVRLHHEFNYAHLAYTSVGQTQKFVDSWRYIVERFKARGASNVGFWWSPAEGGDQSRAEDVKAYPGDAYVDWAGSDGYNWVFVGEDKYATPYESGWVSFGKVFDYPLGFANLKNKHDEFGPRKPFVVGETGTVYDSAHPALKGQWYREIPAYAKANMPHLVGVAFFDVNAAEQGEDARNNWLVDHPASNPGALDGFVDMASDPYLNTRP